jgi:hypothetical protein
MERTAPQARTAPTPPARARLLLVVLAGTLGLWLLAGAQASAAPVISGADGDVWNVANPVPTYVITTDAGNRQISWSVAGVASGTGRSPLTVRLSGIGDGQYRLVARDKDAGTERAFRVDLTPPRITIRQPTSGMQVDQNARLLADYSCQGAVACTGTVPPGAALDTSQTGPATFSVRALDDAGNEALSLVDYLVRAAAAPSAEPGQSPSGDAGSPPPPPSEPIILAPGRSAPWRPLTTNARRLRPAAGAVIRTRRPLLRWKAHPGTKLYNVQLFRVDGRASITKVVTAFPRANRFRVPAGRAAWGTRYIWRVWPYLSQRYSARPLGISYFSVRRL